MINIFTHKEITAKDIFNKKLLSRSILLLVGCLIAAISFNLFFVPFNLACFGVSGASIIIYKKFGIDIGSFMLIISLILLLLSYLLLGKEKARDSALGSILFPLFIKFTVPLTSMINLNTSDLLIIAIFGGLVSGIGYGLIFKGGFTTGGTDILNQIVSKYFKVSIGKAIILVDGFVVLAGGLAFGLDRVMYGIVVLFIISMMSDKVVLGINESKAFYIFTEKEKEIKNYLLNSINVGVTILEAKGGFSGDKQKVLMCIIPTKMYFLVKEGIATIDEKACFVVTDAYQTGNIKNNYQKELY